jgi:hypothetical protein
MGARVVGCSAAALAGALAVSTHAELPAAWWIALAAAVALALRAGALSLLLMKRRRRRASDTRAGEVKPAPRPRVLSPRCQHYAFAHLALRELLFREPLRWVGVLYGPDAEKFLAELWRAVTRQCRAAGQTANLGAEGMRIYQLGLEPCPIVAVQMPPARAATEAHFIGLVLLPPDDDDTRDTSPGEEAADERKPRLLYYTLEKAARSGAEDRTTLCSWTAQGSHLNHGEGPPADLESFGMVLRRLARQRTGGGTDAAS